MRKLIILLALIAVLVPGSAAAQGPEENEDSAFIHINSDTLVAEAETVENLIVINADAVIDGTVTGTLVVIDGDATINGTVEDDLTVIAGDITLNDTATVNNVHSIRGDLTRAPGATVNGDVDENDFTGFWAVLGVFSIILWVGITIAAIVAGIVFAIIGGRQLTAAAMVMTGQAVSAIVGAVVLWVGLPILAVLAIITVIGLPLGLGILLVVLPILGFLGYLVAATRLGSFITGAMNRPQSERPVLAVILGVLVLQIAILVPVIGGLAVFVASIWGAGSLAYTAYRAAGGREVAATQSPVEAT